VVEQGLTSPFSVGKLEVGTPKRRYGCHREAFRDGHVDARTEWRTVWSLVGAQFSLWEREKKKFICQV